MSKNGNPGAEKQIERVGLNFPGWVKEWCVAQAGREGFVSLNGFILQLVLRHKAQIEEQLKAPAATNIQEELMRLVLRSGQQATDSSQGASPAADTSARTARPKKPSGKR